MTTFAKPVKRGCGTRAEGGVYAECGLDVGGKPLDDFLIDPPQVISEALHLSALGVQMIQRQGVWHILDKVGREHYPNVADFVEEVRRFGLSRRLSPTLAFDKLTKDSRIILAHDRAHVVNWSDWRSARGSHDVVPPWFCPKAIPHHAFGVCEDCCAGLWWQDVEGGTADPNGGPRDVVRLMPSFEYQARRRPGPVLPLYTAAFFMWLPIGRLAVVKGDDHERSLVRARRAHLQVDEVDL